MILRKQSEKKHPSRPQKGWAAVLLTKALQKRNSWLGGICLLNLSSGGKFGLRECIFATGLRGEFGFGREFGFGEIVFAIRLRVGIRLGEFGFGKASSRFLFASESLGHQSSSSAGGKVTPPAAAIRTSIASPLLLTRAVSESCMPRARAILGRERQKPNELTTGELQVGKTQNRRPFSHQPTALENNVPATTATRMWRTRDRNRGKIRMLQSSKHTTSDSRAPESTTAL